MRQTQLHWINGVVLPRVQQGGWTVLGTLPQAHRSAYDTGILEMEMGVHNSFVALRNTQSVVGGDYPLGTYMGLHDMAASNQEPRQVRRKQQRSWLASVAQGFIGTMPMNGLTFVVNTGPIKVSKEIGEPINNFLKRKRYATLLAQMTGSDMFALPATLVAPVVYQTTTAALLEEIQRHMLEPTIDNGQTWSIWTLTQIVGYLNERLTRFELETGLIRSSTSIPVDAGTNVVNLPSNMVDLYRLTWTEAGSVSSLETTDTFMLDNGSPGWEDDTGTPWAYIENPNDPLSVQLYPIPSVNGTLTVHMAYALGTMTGAIGEILPIPNCFVPYIKYGVMADMLSVEGEPNDPARAVYCENRYLEGVQVVRLLLGAPLSKTAVTSKVQSGNSSN